MLAFQSAPNTFGTRYKATGMASVSKQKSPFFFGPQDSTDFFKIPTHDVIHIPWSWDFYFDICERHILSGVR